MVSSLSELKSRTDYKIVVGAESGPKSQKTGLCSRAGTGFMCRGAVYGHAARVETGEVTEEVRRLLPMCREPASRKELMGAYLLPALEAGLIERTVPDKPRSHLEWYIVAGRGNSHHNRIKGEYRVRSFETNTSR